MDGLAITHHQVQNGEESLGFLPLMYGLISYVVFLVSFLYAIGFMGNFLVPKGVDSGTAGAVGAAIITNLVRLSIFTVQHTIMARPGFKAAWTKVISKSVERSTFVLLTSLILLLIFWEWQPIGGDVWNLSGTLAMVLWVVFVAGWLLVLLSTFLIDHFDLFGLRQVFLRFRNIHEAEIPRDESLQARSTPDHARFHHRVLGNASHDLGPFPVRRYYDGLHSHGHAVRGNGSGGVARREIRAVPEAGPDDPSDRKKEGELADTAPTTNSVFIEAAPYCVVRLLKRGTRASF